MIPAEILDDPPVGLLLERTAKRVEQQIEIPQKPAFPLVEQQIEKPQFKPFPEEADMKNRACRERWPPETCPNSCARTAITPLELREQSSG